MKKNFSPISICFLTLTLLYNHHCESKDLTGFFDKWCGDTEFKKCTTNNYHHWNETASISENIWKKNSKITVCWGNKGYKAEKKSIKKVILKNWNHKKSSLKFLDSGSWQHCNKYSDKKNKIKIENYISVTFSEDKNQTSSVEFDTVQNTTYKNGKTATNQQFNRININLLHIKNETKCKNHTKDPHAGLKSFALHLFGHALGYYDQELCKEGPCSSPPPHGDPEYDEHSIMLHQNMKNCILKISIKDKEMLLEAYENE